MLNLTFTTVCRAFWHIINYTSAWPTHETHTWKTQRAKYVFPTRPTPVLYFTALLWESNSLDHCALEKLLSPKLCNVCVRCKKRKKNLVKRTRCSPEGVDCRHFSKWMFQRWRLWPNLNTFNSNINSQHNYLLSYRWRIKVLPATVWNVLPCLSVFMMLAEVLIPSVDTNREIHELIYTI